MIDLTNPDTDGWKLRYARITQHACSCTYTARSLHRGAVVRGIRGSATPVKRLHTSSVLIDGESALHGVRLNFTQLHPQLYELSCTHIRTWTNEWANKQRNIMRRFRPTYWNPHATGLHIIFKPETVSPRTSIDVAHAAPIVPPATVKRTTSVVVVSVLSTKFHPIGDVLESSCPAHRISGVSAESTHRQPILSGLVIDEEQRILSREPHTARKLNLHTGQAHVCYVTCCQWRRSFVKYGVRSVRSSHQTAPDNTLRQWFPNIQHSRFLTVCRRLKN